MLATRSNLGSWNQSLKMNQSLMGQLMLLQQTVKSNLDEVEARYGRRLSCQVAVRPSTGAEKREISTARVKISSPSDGWPSIVLECDKGCALPRLVKTAFEMARQRLDANPQLEAVEIGDQPVLVAAL